MSSKPVVGIFEYNKQKVLDRIKLQDRIVEHQVWQTCLNCSNFEEKTENCLQFKARPPAYIIVSGCKDYETDIPF